MKQMISLNELAALWNCHRSTVSRKLLAAGVRPVTFGSSKSSMVRFYLQDVDEYVRRCSGERAPRKSEHN